MRGGGLKAKTDDLEERMASLLARAAPLIKDPAAASLAEEMKRVSKEWRAAHDEAVRHVPSDAEADLARVFIQARMSDKRVDDAEWKAAVTRFREVATAYPQSIEATLKRHSERYLETHIADAFRDARLALAQGPIDPTARFFVARHDHPYGERVRLFANAGDAELWRQEIAAQGWRDDYMSEDERQPLDPKVAADVFFEAMAAVEASDDRHCFEVVEVSIEKPFTPDLPVGWRLCEARDASDTVFGTDQDPFDLYAESMLTGQAALDAQAWIEREDIELMLVAVSADEAERWKLIPVADLPAPRADHDAPAP